MSRQDEQDWDVQTSILKANGYTTDEINNKSLEQRHQMIRNNCSGYQIGDFYNTVRDEHDPDYGMPVIRDEHDPDWLW